MCSGVIQRSQVICHTLAVLEVYPRIQRHLHIKRSLLAAVSDLDSALVNEEPDCFRESAEVLQEGGLTIEDRMQTNNCHFGVELAQRSLRSDVPC